jgi:hypothetical protein
MAKQRPKTMIPPADADRVERLAEDARTGAAFKPPLEATEDAIEIGRRVVRLLDDEHRDSHADDATRNAAYRDLRALAVNGGAAVARRLMRGEAPFKITRHGQLYTITKRFSVPTHLVNGGAAPPDVDEDESDKSSSVDDWGNRQYVQVDFMTWELIEWLRTHLASRRDGLNISVTMLDEILKLKDLHPGLSPRDAMLKAGLDPVTLEIDLDRALASLDEPPDVGIRESEG